MAKQPPFSDDNTDLPDVEPTNTMMIVAEGEMADPLAGLEALELDDGSVDFMLPGLEGLGELPFGANLAEVMDEDELNDIATEQMELYEGDLDSRREWSEIFVEGLEVLGLKYEKRNEPWEDACGVYSSVLTEPAVRFQSETMSETFPPAGPVKTKIIGEETPEATKAAERVREDMNYQLTETMIEYRPEHERLLWSLGLAGSAFKKIYYDPTKGRQVSIYLSAEDVVVPYGESVIEHAERVTHIMRLSDNYVKKMQAMGFYREVDIGEGDKFENDFHEIKQAKAEEDGYSITRNDEGKRAVLEMHVELVIESMPEGEDDIAKPYILTIDKSSNEVLGLRRNWREGDITYKKQQHLVHYCYMPGFGFYGMGLIHLVGGYARGGTSIIRQLVDAGTLSNLPGGMKSKDLRTSELDNSPVAPGEWRDVSVPSGSIRDHIMPLPYGEPSQTLLSLLGIISEEGRRLGGVADLDISDMSANAPVGTTLALLERILKPMSSIQARVHYAMKQEFKLLKEIIAENSPSTYDYNPAGGEERRFAKGDDYALVEVIPVSDPNSATMAQRVVQYQTVMQMSQQVPQIYNLPFLHRQMLEVIGIKEAEKIVTLPEDATPRDPVSENMGVLTGAPLKAFIYQDHDAHIKAHMAFLQDPMIASTIGQSPMAQQAMASLQAHISEHLGYSYRRQMEEALGAPLPPPDEQLDETIEVNLSRLVADGAQMLTQMHQKAAAEQEAQQQAQDPNLQIKRMEAEIKKAEVERKAKKDQADIGVRQAEQQRKTRSDIIDAQLEKEKIAQDRRETELEADYKNIETANERAELDRRIKMDLLNKFLDTRPTPPDRGGNNNGGER